jgi:hypothetical protein
MKKLGLLLVRTIGRQTIYMRSDFSFRATFMAIAFEKNGYF